MYFRRRSGLGALGLLGGYYGWRNRDKIREYLGSNEQLKNIFTKLGLGGSEKPDPQLKKVI